MCKFRNKKYLFLNKMHCNDSNKYVVSVIDYNISLFGTASWSNYVIIDYTMLQSASIVILRNGICH